MKFYPDIAAPKSLRHEPHCAGTEEWIEDKIPGPARCFYARLYKLRRERRKMSAGKPLCVNVPYGATIAAVYFNNGLAVVVGTLFFREHEQVLVRPRWPVFYAFRHRIWFVPHKVGPKIPAVLLQSQRKPPWNAKQVFRLQPFGRVRPNGHGPGWILLVRGAPATVSARIAIAYIQPKNAVLTKDSPDLREDSEKLIDELRQRRFQADLVRYVVIPQSPIRR